MKQGLEMEVNLLGLEAGAREARGPVAIIGVFRAFTCAPMLFHLGWKRSFSCPSPPKA